MLGLLNAIKVHLRKHRLEDLIPMGKVFTNPSWTDEDGGLRVSPFLPKRSDGKRTHDCPLCSSNMCKGDVVDRHRRRRREEGKFPADKVFYVGDGRNDFCPSMRLSETDVVFCRVGYKLEKLLRRELAVGPARDTKERRLRAKVVFYSDARDVLEEMKKHLKL